MNKSFLTVKSQRDLGVMSSTNLSWNENTNRRATKPMSFFEVKRSLSHKCSITLNRSAYTEYVVPILNHAFQTWVSSKEISATLNKVQNWRLVGSWDQKKLIRKNKKAEVPSLSLCGNTRHPDVAGCAQ